MASYLFFDDQRLLVREGFTRQLGKPELIPDTLYREGNVSAAVCHVWQESENSFYLFYQSFLWDIGNRTIIRVAHSTDGLHFSPVSDAAAQAGIENPHYPDQIIPGWDAELAAVVDSGKSPGRLKMFISAYEPEKWKCHSDIWQSDDGVHWEKTVQEWHRDGTEPLAGIFYNPYYQHYTLICRPFWGTRRVNVSTTQDLCYFTEPQPLLQCDALDEPLVETYGMPAFSYKDMFVGLLHLYHTVPSDTWKFMGGKMDVQLACSYDGEHWMRSLRIPFMENAAPFEGMIFTNFVRSAEDGSILLYASGTDGEHGNFSAGNSAIGVFRLREDGFIHLKAEGDARLRTRETILGDHFDINLCCEAATCALFTQDGQEILGFTHADCVPFSGDCTHWMPCFQGDMAALKGRVVTIEIKMKKGNIYGINGDFIKLMNIEAWRYEKFGTPPSHANP